MTVVHAGAATRRRRIAQQVVLPLAVSGNIINVNVIARVQERQKFLGRDLASLGSLLMQYLDGLNVYKILYADFGHAYS